MSAAGGLVVVPELGDGNVAGTICWWRLSGGLDLDAMEAWWQTEKLPETWLPQRPSAAVAIRRAADTLRERRRLVRPLDRGGFAVVREYEREEGKLTHATEMIITLDRVGRCQVDVRLEECEPDAAMVRAAYEKHLVTLSQADVSAWLARIMVRVEAVSLRDTGGVYFVPRPQQDVWGKIVGAVRQSSAHVVSSVPAMKTEEAVAAFLDALAQEANSELDTVRTDMANGAMGVRALQARQQVTERVEHKLAAYEDLLGTGLPDVRAKIDELRAAVAVAMLAAQAQADAAE